MPWMTSLFSPVKLGAIDAPNRILMAPLTRGRATRGHVPTPLMGKYYAQRSSAGLIISEATGISQQGLGWAYAPGLWSDEQMTAWKAIVEEVHNAGGRIAAQLWHMGRLVHPDFLGGASPVSASATTAPGHAHTYSGAQPYARSRALEPQEIKKIVEDYTRATEHAMIAGFDGVQLHAANGYLIDQFLRDGTNLRVDSYGGAIENRIQLLIEATQALIGVAGANRISVRLSPNDDPQGCGDSDSESLFTEVAKALDALQLGFLDLRASRRESTFRPATRQLVPAIRRVFKGKLILNSDYTLEEASQALRIGEADAIAFGRPFLANPDLPARFAGHAALNAPNPKTFYTAGPAGYTDYPKLT
jgi:N-ethylmaleimide reductase